MKVNTHLVPHWVIYYINNLLCDTFLNFKIFWPLKKGFTFGLLYIHSHILLYTI